MDEPEGTGGETWLPQLFGDLHLTFSSIFRVSEIILAAKNLVFLVLMCTAVGNFAGLTTSLKTVQVPQKNRKYFGNEDLKTILRNI